MVGLKYDGSVVCECLWSLVVEMVKMFCILSCGLLFVILMWVMG